MFFHSPSPAGIGFKIPVHPDLLAALQERQTASGGLTYADFTELALYHPTAGYYRRKQPRVGRTVERDFYTASTLGGQVFARLILAALENLAQENCPEKATLVEGGAEPDHDLFAGLHLPFRSRERLILDTPVSLPPHTVFFANELMDAQPFQRLQFLDGKWREWGVHCSKEGLLTETLLPELSFEIRTKLAPLLPPEAPENYRLDISLAGETLLRQLIQPIERGVLLLLDYGRTWPEMLEHCPAGSARAYYRHQMEADLLARPGEQDLTCHVCWDRLADVLRQGGWQHVKILPQESLFIHHSLPVIQSIIEQNPGHFDPQRQTLHELLHPAHMGRKFQALVAVKNP